MLRFNILEKSVFSQNFSKAISTLLPFAQEFLIEILPEKLNYLVFLNQSHDENKLIGDEKLFPEDSLPENRVKSFELDEQIINFLWRDGKVPEWINLHIHSFDNEMTFISVVCCGRFTSDEKLLYHQHEGYQPFHVLGPNLPIDYKGLEQSGKFNFYWHGRKPNLDEPYY